MNSERFWAVYAQSYDLMWDSPVTAATRAVVQSQLGAVSSVVDLGSGTGLMSAGLVERGVEVIGVDSSAAMLERAASRLTVAVRAPAEAVPLEDATADAVIIGNLLHLHPHPAAVVDEARRLLKPGGVIVATWPVPGLTPAAIWRADRAAGRALLPSLRAQVLRLRTGLLAARAGGVVAARASGAHDTASLLAALGLDPAHPVTTVAGCQQVVLL